MFKRAIAWWRYVVGKNDFINGSTRLQKCEDIITIYVLSQDERCVSFFSSEPEQVKAIRKCLEVIDNKCTNAEANNG